MSPTEESPATPLPALPPGYTLHPGAFPTVTEYRHLRAASGLTPMTEAQSRAVPNGTWYGCYVTFSGEKRDDPQSEPSPESSATGNVNAVAMGRIVGDGGWYFVIADMAVLPDHQRKGLGDAILKHLLAYIRANAPEGDPFVNLTADPPGMKLYARNGFKQIAPKGIGMMLPANWREKP